MLSFLVVFLSLFCRDSLYSSELDQTNEKKTSGETVQKQIETTEQPKTKESPGEELQAWGATLPPLLNIYLIDSDGQVLEKESELPFTFRQSLRIEKIKSNATALGLFREIQVTPKAGGKMITNSSFAKQAVKKVSPSEVVFDYSSKLNAAMIKYEDEKLNKVSELGLQMDETLSAAYLISDSSCSGMGIVLSKKKGKISPGENGLFIASCSETSDTILISINHPEDWDISILQESNPEVTLQKQESKLAAETYYWTEISIGKKEITAKKIKDKTSDYSFDFSLESDGKKQSSHVLTYDPDNTKNKFYSLEAGLSLSYWRYSETLTNTELSLFGPRPNLGGKIYLFSRKVEIEGFATLFLFPITSNLSTNPRNLTTHLKVGYRFFQNGTMGLYASLGSQFWSMLVPDASYGAAYLAGPVTSLRMDLKNGVMKKPLSVEISLLNYFNTDSSFRFSDRTLALQVTQEVGKWSGLQVKPYLNASHTAFSTVGTGNTLGAYSLSLGANFGL